MKIRVGVIFGGESVEHEVSVISAVQAMHKMDTEKYEIVPIYITKDRKWRTGEILKDIETYQDMDLLKRYTKEVVLLEKMGRFVLQEKLGMWKKEVKEIDIAFPIVHGTNVEDGVLQGYLTMIGIPFVGVDVYAAVVGQDKVFMKDIFVANGISVPKYIWFYDTEYDDDKEKVLKDIEKKLSYPVIVKPATLGSSVGIHVAENREKLVEAIEDAVSYDKKIIVEEVVANLREVNISVLGNVDTKKLSVIEEVLSEHAILTYEDKYVGSSKTKGAGKVAFPKKSKGMASASRMIPAKIDKKVEEKVREMALLAAKALGSSGVVRIDFLIDDAKKEVYINEVNSIPGSLSFYLWEPCGKDYTDLLDEMINLGIKDYKKRSAKTHSFDTNILKGFSELGGVKGRKFGKLK